MKKGICLSLFVLLCTVIFSTKVTVKGSEKKIDMTFSISDSFSLTNSEGKVLTYRAGQLTGNMKVYENKRSGLTERIITIDMCSKFTYISKRRSQDISFSNNTWFSSVKAKDAQSIIVKYGKDASSIQIQGKDVPFNMYTDSVLTEDSFITITGTGTNVGLKNSKQGIEMTNLTGVCDFESDDLQFKKNSETKLRFLPISNKVRIKNPISKKLKVSGAIPYSSKVAKKVENLRVIPVSKISQAISFNKVKKAKGYAVYRKTDGGKAEQVAVLTGNASTVWVDRDIPAGQVRAYYICSYKIKGGKKVYAKRSYLVSGVTSSDTLSSATKVTLNKSGKIKLKKGKTLKLKAKITGEKGKKLVSKDIRWCSLNKKKVIVDKNGKVKALKKGTCKIYAKAHNGKNSKAIIIKVV